MDVDQAVFNTNIQLLKVFIILLGILLTIFAIKFLPKHFGSLNHSNLKIGKQQNVHGIILGRLGKWLLYSPEDQEGHSIILGGSGSAKTTSVLLPTLFSWRGGFFTIDISGDIASNINRYDMIYKAIKYEPLNPDSSVIYNPFHAIDALYGDALINEALEKMAYIIIPDKSQGDSSKWFDDGGRSIITAAFICFYHQDLDFQDICLKITDNDYLTLFKTIDDSQNTNAIRHINQFAGMSEKNIAGCYQSAQAAVKVFVNPVIEGKLRRQWHANEEILTPESIERGRIFFIIPDSKKEQYAPLVELIVSQLLDYISDRPYERVQHKVLLAIDEYASFKNLDLAQPLAKSRKKGCRIMILCQNLNQISRNFGELAMREIVDNCDINVLCRISEPQSQQYFSMKSGTLNRWGNDAEFRHDNPVYKPEDFGKLRKTNIILCRGEHFRVFKNYFWKYYRRD